MFKHGNLVRRIDSSGDERILTVTKDFNSATDTYVRMDDKDGVEWLYEPDEIDFVAESAPELEKITNPQPMEEQTVAIVSFEGAVKREVKAIREAIKCCDSVSSFKFTVIACGAVNDGEIKIEYSIGREYGGIVNGNNVKECLSEFLRRHGWDRTNKPIAISYDGIPT